MREPFIVVILPVFLLMLIFNDDGHGPSGFPELVKG